MPLEHGDALRLGRVRGQHRPDTQPLNRLADRGRRDPGIDGRRQCLCQGSGYVVASAIALERPALAHVAVLLGDREQLEPDALRLHGPGQQGSRHALGRRRAAQDPRHGRFVALDHPDQEVEQEPRTGKAVERPDSAELGLIRQACTGHRTAVLRPSASATVDPSSDALGATRRPCARMISAFSAAESPSAEIMAPA